MFSNKNSNKEVKDLISYIFLLSIFFTTTWVIYKDFIIFSLCFSSSLFALIILNIVLYPFNKINPLINFSSLIKFTNKSSIVPIPKY